MLSQTNGAKGGVLKILASCGWYFNKYLSMYILWNKPTLKQSIKDVEKRFNIKIKI